MEEKLEHLAYYDQLTGTMFRTVFMDRLKISIEEANKKKFKTFSAVYGH